MTTAVQEFPPREDFNIFVRVEFLKGMNCWSLFLLNFEMTCVR